jgi:hypothetical protein
MAHSFADKLNRARHHFNELELEIERWRKSRPYRIVDELDSDTGDNVIYGQLLRFPPSHISQLIGDCLQNLRCSLDHLAYALAVKNKGSLTDSEAIDTAFPIFITQPGFRTRGKGRIKHLSRGAQTAIDALQPYHTPQPDSHRLWLLKTLNDIDKHRRLLVTLATLIGAGVQHPLGTHLEFFDWSPNGAFGEDKTEIARYRCFDPETSNRVKVEFRPTIHVVFGDISAEERIVFIILDEIYRGIRGIVFPRLRPFL